MRRSDAYWNIGEIVSEVRDVVEDAWGLTRQGESRAALAVLDAITEVYIDEWTYFDDSEGEVSSLFYHLTPAWSEALLSTDLTAEEREDWAHRLDVWSNEIEDYGIDGFWEAVQAARQGWDHPLIQKALRGEPIEEISDDEPDDEENDEELDDVFFTPLIDARLNVLERQGKTQEFLNLARVTHQHARYAVMLARLGRSGEAIEHVHGNLRQASQVVPVAEALWEQGEQDQALALAGWGITLPEKEYSWQLDPQPSLAVWLRDRASELGQREPALKGAVVAWRETTDLPNYLKVQELAGDDWPELRESLLEELRQPPEYGPSGHVDIFLHEGMIDEAIAEVERWPDHRLVERVAQAAVDVRPDWVITVSKHQAEEIIGAARSDAYAVAVHWLDLARSAYPRERRSEWLAYLDDLIEREKRKYKLRPMLENLRNASGRG